MTNEEGNSGGADHAVTRIAGKLHSVRSTDDDSGEVIPQIPTPTMVDFRFQDVCEIIVGACVLAIPIAFTEEVWRLGEDLPWVNIGAVAAVSIVVVALFVYFIFYKDHIRGNTLQYLLRVSACYAITLLVVAIILTMFQKCPWHSDMSTAIKRVILVGFPACFSATVIDSLK